MLYEGQVALITGSASGIGLGITRHLLKEGCNVLIADVNEQAGRKVAEELSADKEVIFKQTDVTSWSSQCAAFSLAAKSFGGRLDYVFANAGITQMTSFRSSDPTHFATTLHEDLSELQEKAPDLRVIRVDLDGVLYSMHAALAYFRRQETDRHGWRGKFIATGSEASLNAFANDTLYTAAKHGVWGAVKAAGVKVFHEGITVNCLAPSAVRTGLADPAFFDQLEARGLRTPVKTVTDAVDLILAPGSKFTGQCIENVVEENVFRQQSPWMNDHAREVMNEFHPSDEVDEVLSVKSYGLRVV